MPEIAYSKAKSLYDTYERKGKGETITHYCPGCGHGVVQKLIATAIDELHIQDRTIFLSPVGCSVFSYYYFDTGNVQCSHGRAPAVATGIKRTHSDAIIISYQGDGDLAGIGITEILHAANRGENITVFFINNAIYGMTGGQMAPTTPLGGKTLTTPFGRSFERDGNPLRMAEIIAAMESPVYVERCTLSTAKGVVSTQKAIRKALEIQLRNEGFSFVEILSPCPTNWHMSSVESREWMKREMEKLFPVNLFRDVTVKSFSKSPAVDYPYMDDDSLIALLQEKAVIPIEKTVSLRQTQQIKISGFGGQGVLSAGELLATCGMFEGFHVSWLPSYGPEMRGGSAHVSVILSQETIGSPLVERPDVLIAMNGPSLDHFEDEVVPNGLIILNSSIIQRKVTRTDVRVIAIPATEMAQQAGLLSAANVVMTTAYLVLSKIMPLEILKKSIPLVLRKKAFLEKNLSLVERTLSYMGAYVNC